jgi:hypothetical protein
MPRLEEPMKTPVEAQRRRAELSEDPVWRGVRPLRSTSRRRARVTVRRSGAGDIEFPAMLADGTFSGGERHPVEIAASRFNQANLWSMLHKLDGDNAVAVERAIHAFPWKDPQVSEAVH